MGAANGTIAQVIVDMALAGERWLMSEVDKRET
jgi:hypothetical protein